LPLAEYRVRYGNTVGKTAAPRTLHKRAERGGRGRDALRVGPAPRSALLEEGALVFWPFLSGSAAFGFLAAAGACLAAAPPWQPARRTRTRRNGSPVASAPPRRLRHDPVWPKAHPAISRGVCTAQCGSFIYIDVGHEAPPCRALRAPAGRGSAADLFSPNTLSTVTDPAASAAASRRARSG